MRPTLRVLVLTVAATLATGCDSLFFVEAETEEICKTESSVSFPAAPPGTLSLRQAFSLPLGDVGESLPEGQMESELRLRLFEITALSGNPDLRGIEFATITAQPSDPAIAPIKLLDYQRPASGASANVISITGTNPVDVLALAREERLPLVFEARGSLPQQAWTAKVQICAGLRARVSYSDFIF